MSTADATAAGAALLAGYLLGGVPFAFVLGKLRGIDIRRAGSGNIGATNLGRALGHGWGIAALALDIAKGFVPVLLLSPIIAVGFGSSDFLTTQSAMGLGAVLGHVFTPYLRFRGGKGVATTIGVFAALIQFWLVLPVAGYAVARKTTGFVSAGSITLAALLPAAAILKHRTHLASAWSVIALAGAAAVLVLVRHASNITRLIRGQEHAAPGRREAAAGPRTAEEDR